MDNDFQYPPSQRTEREEYRSRFRFTDEDAPKRSKASQKDAKTKTDYLVRLILLQSVLCILIVGGVFLVSKISPMAYEKMKTDYGRIMQRDMSAGEIMGQIKKAAEFVFKPADIAESVDLSESRFRVLFAAVYGISPHKYLTDVRISAAKEMLWNTEIPLLEIAEKCGFGSQQYLTDTFKKSVGISPGKYRVKFAKKYTDEVDVL